VCKHSLLKNLLEGNVILAQNNKNIFNYAHIIAHKKVSLNFYLANQQIYRNKEKLLTNIATTELIMQKLHLNANYLLKSLYLIQKHNQNSIF